MQCKAYLYDYQPSQTKEIRRFTIDADVLSSYEYLKQKVASAFPNLSKKFSLQWKDDDDDLVWFNSDEELMEALSHHSPGNVFKLYIKDHCPKVNKSSPKHGTSEDWLGSEFAKLHNRLGRFDFSGASSSCPFAQRSTGTNKQDVGGEYLQHVGNTVADWLSAFGVDADVNVEHRGERNKCHGKKQAESTNEASPPSKKESSDASTKKKSERDDAGDSSDPEWTFVKSDDDDHRLRTSLDQLKNMGFEDTGGWLTSLLKSSNYDVGKVLDALHSYRA